MPYSSILKPRPEVLSDDGIEGIIDLANLSDIKKRKIEACPELFFNLTFPTADIKRVVSNIHDRFAGKDAPGTFIFEGLKGSGKSHMLLLVYHLFKNNKAAQDWLKKHSLTCNVPEDCHIVVQKFTDSATGSVWDAIYKELTGKSGPAAKPSLEEFKKIIGDKKLIVIYDELEQGIKCIESEAKKAQSIAFLQMISEWSNRSNQITVFSSIYSDDVEPGSTLKRVPTCRIKFEHDADRARIILHRIFENFLDVRREQFAPVVDSYISLWKKHSAIQNDDVRSQLMDSYPFSPDILQIILNRVPARGGFQNVRGALGFLAHMVKMTHKTCDIITPADADLCDREIATRLSDIDNSGQLISNAKDNIKELQSSFPLAGRLSSVIMLYTITAAGHNKGTNREEVLRAILAPSIDINDFEKTIIALPRYASYLHYQESRYFFDRDENPDAKVELRSLSFRSNTQAIRELVSKIWKEEVFRDNNAVIFNNANETKEHLEKIGSGRLKFAIAPLRLQPYDRHDLYNGLKDRNETVLLEPKDAGFDAFRNEDVCKWAARVLAAEALYSSIQDSAKRAIYDRIGKEDRRLIIDTIKRAGFIYVRIEKFGATMGDDIFEEEPLSAYVKEDIIRALNNDLYPERRVAEHIHSRFEDLKNKRVRDIDDIYRKTLAFPVPTYATTISGAIRLLAKEGKLSVKHQKGNYCHSDPLLNESEMALAVIDYPLEQELPLPQPGSLPFGQSPAMPPQTANVNPLPTSTIPGGISQEIATTQVQNSNALRQELASKLQEFKTAAITRIKFTVYFEQTAGDLSAFPASIRGQISGSGNISGEINITKEGNFAKPDIEKMAESLPSIVGASYFARLTVVVPQGEGNDAD